MNECYQQFRGFGGDRSGSVVMILTAVHSEWNDCYHRRNDDDGTNGFTVMVMM